MKQFRNLFVLVATLLTTSCSDESGLVTTTNEKTDKICFDIDFANASRVATDKDYNSIWEVGDAVGVYAVKQGETLSATAGDNFLHNIKLTYDGTRWNAETDLRWPNSGGTFVFYAYYPYDANATNPTSIDFCIDTNQYEADNFKTSDLLASDAVTATAGDVVRLPFKHMLAMVELQIPYKRFNPNESAAITIINPSSTTVASLRRINTQCTLNLVTQEVTNTEIDNWGMSNMWQNIKMYRVEQPSDFGYDKNYTYRALLPAQTLLTRDRLFLLADEEQDYLQLGYDVENEIVLTKGNAIKLKCNLMDGGHEVTPIPAGEYYMGSTPEDIATYASSNEFSDKEYDLSDETRHQVTFTKSFLMGTYEVTCSQFAEFLNTVGVEADGKYAQAEEQNKNKVLVIDCTKKEYSTQSSEDSQKKENGLIYNPSTSSWELIDPKYANHPVTHVSWSGAYEYAKWAGGALPTEAQWEYACRAGETSYSTFAVWDYDNDGTINDTATDYAWFGGNNTDDDTHPVGQKMPNAWGLYDMRGNVYEYCLDTYNKDYYTTEAKTDPTGPDTDAKGTQNMKILRGGSWLTRELRTRSAFKFTTTNAQSGSLIAQQQWGMDSHFGFRIVYNE